MKISDLKEMIKKSLLENEDEIGLGDSNTTEDFDDLGDGDDSGDGGDAVSEAKKKKTEDTEDISIDDIADETPTEETPSEDTDTTVDISTDQVNPNVKAVQDALTQAQAAAKNLGDDKLTDQIGNTITFFTRSHIVGGNQEETNLDEIELYEIRRMKRIAGIIK